FLTAAFAFFSVACCAGAWTVASSAHATARALAVLSSACIPSPSLTGAGATRDAGHRPRKGGITMTAAQGQMGNLAGPSLRRHNRLAKTTPIVAFEPFALWRLVGADASKRVYGIQGGPGPPAAPARR